MIQQSGPALGETVSDGVGREVYDLLRDRFSDDHLGFVQLVTGDLEDIHKYSDLEGIQLTEQEDLNARSVIHKIERALRYFIEESGLEGEELAEQVNSDARAIKNWLNRMQEQGIHIPERELVHYSRERGYPYKVGERVPVHVSSSRRIKDEVKERWATARRIGMPPELLPDLVPENYEWMTSTWYNQKTRESDDLCKAIIRRRRAEGDTGRDMLSLYREIE